MVLIFLIILGFLVYAILDELERGKRVTEVAAGSCPGCAQTVEEDWLLCPRCRILLKQSCSGCGKHHASYHSFCPWCGVAKENCQNEWVADG